MYQLPLTASLSGRFVGQASRTDFPLAVDEESVDDEYSMIFRDNTTRIGFYYIQFYISKIFLAYMNSVVIFSECAVLILWKKTSESWF